LFFWLTTRIRNHQNLIPSTPLTRLLLAMYFVCGLYVLHPDIPFWVGISAFRGWCLFSISFLLAFDLFRSPRQVKVYLLFVVLVAVLTSFYGLYQYTAGIENVLDENEIAVGRHLYSTYATTTGEVEFRIFSTFVSAGAFGDMMAYASFLALTLSVSKALRTRTRILLVLAIFPMLTSLVLTGTRAALAMMVIGLCVLWWYKRNIRVYLIAMVLIYVGIQLGIGLTEGRAADRFASLADPDLLMERLSAPFVTGFGHLLEWPLGRGLGRTGHGVPFFLVGGYPHFRMVFSDGDFGRIMVEMGVVGLIMLCYVLLTAIRGAFRGLHVLRNTRNEELALAILGGSVMIGIGTLVGSPFLSIPQGMLWWFFLGAIYKMTLLHERERSETWHPAPASRRRVRWVVRA
ncbi:MAG: hypothetical protein HY650_05770, partial [Acidobacteria bacterium]|nr:hypothetical protein [Acidobacteriota bacterium]